MPRTLLINDCLHPYTSKSDKKQWVISLFYLSLPFLLYLRIAFLQRRRDIGDFATVDTYAATQILIVIIIWIVLILTPRFISTLKKLSATSVGLLILFYAFCGISAVWSPFKAYTLYRAIEVMGVCFIIFFALDSLNDFKRAELLALGFSSLILIISVLRIGFISNWRYMHSNMYPMIASIMLCYCLGELSQESGSRKKILQSCAIISFISLCLGTSSSANVAALCGLVSIGIIRKNKIRFLLIILLIVVLLLLLTGWSNWIENAVLKILFPNKSLELIESVNGRRDIWNRCWPIFIKQPLLGYGFAAAPRLSLDLVSAHNTFMDILIATGIIGVLFFTISIIALFHELLQIETKTLGYVGCLAAFTSAFIGSMGISFIAIDINSSMISFACFLGLYAYYVLSKYNPMNFYNLKTKRQTDFF